MPHVPPTSPRPLPQRSLAPWAALFMGGLLFGCEGQIGAAGSDGAVVDGGTSNSDSGMTGPFDGAVVEGCVDDDQFYSRDVWSSTVSQRCFGCHSAQGVAGGTDFILADPQVRIDAHESNYQALVRIATSFAEDGDPRPLLLRKPLGELDHGGGHVIQVDTLDYARLEAFVERQDMPVMCEDGGDILFDGVEMESAYRTLRRVALTFAYRLPTDEEIARVDAGGEAALSEVLDEMMNEEAFGLRIAEGFNDLFLTSGAQIEIAYLGTVNHPGLMWFRDLPADQQGEALLRSVDGIRMSVTHLIKHIFLQDEPFSQLLLADYTMVNPYIARSFDVFDGIDWADPWDPEEFHPAQLTLQADRRPYPHAGILNNYIYLARFPSTDTNLNRARSRAFMLQFLGTDILRFAPLNADPLAIIAEYDNPIRDATDCAICHAIIDPIAGLYRNHHTRGARYRGPVPEDTFPPGFELTTDDGPDVPYGEREWNAGLLPEARGADSLRWLAERTVEDPRFALTLIRHFYEIVIGRPALTVPEGAPSIERDGAFTAFEAQRAFLRDLAETFVASNYDAKAVVRSLLLSPYYRARYESSRTEETDAARFDLGVAQLMTPEMFHRKIVAIFGDSFQSYPLWEDSLMAFNRYRTLYGGIDADTVTERLREPTGIMGGVQHLVANNVSCRQASREFDKAPEARRLLDLVELDTFLPAQEDTIRAQLVRLHERLLGERLSTDHPEIDRSYALFRRVRDQGAEEIAARRTSPRLGRPCEAGDITEDPDFVVRAWAAVMNYQMLTFEFLYQ